MTKDDESNSDRRNPSESGIEYRATIRFPQRDYEFMQKLIEEGEYTNITEIVRDAVKRFRLEYREDEAMRNFMPGPWMNMGPMPWMRTMRRRSFRGGYGNPPTDQDE